MSALLYPERHLAVTLNEVKGAMLDMAPFAALRVTVRRAYNLPAASRINPHASSTCRRSVARWPITSRIV